MTTKNPRNNNSYLEVQDDGPYEAEGELGVAVDNVLAADVDQLDLLVAQEAQRRLHVLDGVEAHSASLSRLHKTIFCYLKAFQKEPIKSFALTLLPWFHC